MQTVDAGTGEKVTRAELVRGFQIARDQYVPVDREEFDAVKSGATRTLDSGKVVPRASIGQPCRDTPSPPVPPGKTGVSDLT